MPLARLSRLVLTLALVLAPLVGWAGDIALTGTVTTKADGLSVPGATVTITGLGLTATTDPQGRFAIALPAEQAGKTVEVRVQAPGLPARSSQVKIEGATVTVDFALTLGFHEDVVVGSRASGAEAEKAVPVDILTREQITLTGASETSQIIQALAPSFNFPRPTLSDGADTVRPATLRGLGPDQVLVLLNGKRRHTSAHIPTSGVIGRGSTGVDLNAFPASALERVEVLRDGAAAQYGSDAISGVINIVMRSGKQPLTISGKTGMTQGSFRNMFEQDVRHGDGELTEGTASYGFNLGRGSVFLAGEYRNRNGTNRASPDNRDQVVAGDARNNQVKQPNHHWGDSEQRDVMGFLNASVPLNQDDTSFLYAFGGFARRTGSHGGFYRRALDNRNWPQIYPLGFLPTIQPVVIDSSGTVGVRGVKSLWFWDLSAQYGHNSFRFDLVNTLNTSLGPTSKTDFYAGTLLFDQILSNLDLSRQVDVGLAGPLNLAFGLEYRRENYRIEAGEPDSYRDGGSPNPFGGRAVPGAQVFPGYRPSNEVDASRNTVAGYLDFEGDLAKWLRLGLAGRFENYSAGGGNPEDDFGSTADGKLTVRIEPYKRVVIRGAASTGFRAPSLAQSHFSTVSTNFINIGGVVTPVEVGTFAVGSPVAQAMGAQVLKPEDSVNYSAGIVVNPADNLDITLDFYRIEIDDRIVFSGNFTGARIEALVLSFGATGGRFFTNAIDTDTEGLDLTVNYKVDMKDAGTLRLSGSYNHTETKLVGSIATPPQLSGLANVLFDREQTFRVTCGQPKDSLRLTGNWRIKRLTTNLRVNRYGPYCFATNTPANDQTLSPKWVADLELTYQKDKVTLGIGSQNLFDTFPDRLIPANSSFQIQTFPGTSPFGMNGRFLYMRASYRF